MVRARHKGKGEGLFTTSQGSQGWVQKDTRNYQVKVTIKDQTSSGCQLGWRSKVLMQQERSQSVPEGEHQKGLEILLSCSEGA